MITSTRHYIMGESDCCGSQCMAFKRYTLLCTREQLFKCLACGQWCTLHRTGQDYYEVKMIIDLSQPLT